MAADSSWIISFIHSSEVWCWMMNSISSWCGGWTAAAAPRMTCPGACRSRTQCLHAAGAALAFKLRHEPRVAVSVVGDGGTSKTDFYAA
jgi:hypothetical protein